MKPKRDSEINPQDWDFNYFLNTDISMFLKCNQSIEVEQIDFHSLFQNPLPCSCSGSEFLYAPCGHLVTGDLNIVRNDENDKIRNVYAKARNTESLSHFHGTRTSILSWTNVKRTPGGRRRKRMSNFTLFLSGLKYSIPQV